MQLADGNKTVKIPYPRRSDEIGDTARVADIFRDSLVRMEQIETEQKHVEERLKAERRAEMHLLADTFERVLRARRGYDPRRGSERDEHRLGLGGEVVD